MKRTLIALSVAAALAGCSAGTQNGTNMELALDNDDQKVSYGMGLILGERMRGDLPDLEMDQFLEGFRHGHGNSDSPLMTREEVQLTLMEYQRRLHQEQMAEMEALADENRAAGEAFLAENGQRAEVTTTESGLQYEVLEEGEGKKPGATDQVQVHYTGELLSGDVFDSSRERGQPVTFGLNQVITGWTEGLQLMSEGSRYRFYIPSDLAYGPGGNQAIGPNETLVFDVELLAVNPD